MIVHLYHFSPFIGRIQIHQMKSWSLNHELHFSLSLPLMIFLPLYLLRRLLSTAVKNAALWVARSATRGRTNKWRADHTRLHTVKQIFLFWLRPLEHDSLSLISLSLCCRLVGEWGVACLLFHFDRRFRVKL